MNAEESSSSSLLLGNQIYNKIYACNCGKCLQVIITVERMDYPNDRDDLSDKKDKKLKTTVKKLATWISRHLTSV